MERCWCGNPKLVSYSKDYNLCNLCKTLVTNMEVNESVLQVKNDEIDFYGKNYWLEASAEFPDIFVRSRNDLRERNLHWLKYLLKYKLPPGRVLEVGCAHGSFLAILQHIGFQVTGMEMSPWVIEYAKNIFHVDVKRGPIETSNLAMSDKFDVIAMMDVMEHLNDPVETIKSCLDYLADDGILLIQMPCFPSHLESLQVLDGKHPFEKMMLPSEHLYLFSENSATQFFKNLGLTHIQFLPAIFDHYDMFFVVSRKPLECLSDEKIDSNLSSSVNGRIIQALLDLRESEVNYMNHYVLRNNLLVKVKNFVSKKIRKSLA